MAAPPAVTPIMRSRSRRLGEGAAELFSIPTSKVEFDSRSGFHRRPANGLRDQLSHEAPSRSRRHGAVLPAVVLGRGGQLPIRRIPAAPSPQLGSLRDPGADAVPFFILYS